MRRMVSLPSTSTAERHWNAEVARRRPDLVAEEAAPLERMAARYLDLVGSAFGVVAGVATDRVRVLRHLIDEAGDERAERQSAAREAGRHLAAQVGPGGKWTERQAERLAALIDTHAGASPDLMPTGDGAIVVSFGPRRGNGAYVLEPDGGSRWVTPKRYAA
jgi:hypothetical protein